MTTSTIIAGDLNNFTALVPGNDGSLVVSVGPAGSKVNGLLLAADGTPSFSMARGGIAQIVSAPFGALSTGTTVLPLDDTIPQITEGDQYMSATITPKNAASTLEVSVVFYGACQTSGHVIAALFRDSTANALMAGLAYSNFNATPGLVTFTCIVTAGSTSATTFRVRAGGGSGGTTYFNGTSLLTTRVLGGVSGSSITIKEYLP